MRSLLRLFLLLLPATASAGAPPALPSPGAIAMRRFYAAERTVSLPPRVLSAIAEVESGRPDAATGALHPWPWTIDAEGRGQFFATKATGDCRGAGIAGAGHAIDRRGLHAGEPDASPERFCLAGRSVRSVEQRALRRTLSEHAVHGERQLAAGNCRVSFRDTRHWRGLSPARDGTVAASGRRGLAGWAPARAAYRDFAPKNHVYGAFRPTGSVYGVLPGPLSRLEQLSRR